MSPQRLQAVACEVLYREMCFCAARSRNIVDLRFLTQGLHDLGAERMRERLQQEIDAVDSDRYAAVLLAYALCNNGVAGVRAPSIPLVVPRAHDCITFFFGSREKYRAYFDRCPGTYFVTTGWIERDRTNLEDVGDEVRTQLGLGKTYEEYAEQYGEENARYLVETLGDTRRHYDRLAYIDMGIQESLGYDQQTAREAAEKGWAFERLEGDLGLLADLVDGNWAPDRFLVVRPGEQIVATYDDGIIECAPA